MDKIIQVTDQFWNIGIIIPVQYNGFFSQDFADTKTLPSWKFYKTWMNHAESRIFGRKLRGVNGLSETQEGNGLKRSGLQSQGESGCQSPGFCRITWQPVPSTSGNRLFVVHAIMLSATDFPNLTPRFSTGTISVFSSESINAVRQSSQWVPDPTSDCAT